MKVGEFFTLDEFIVSQEAVRRGISNEPTEEAIEQIRVLCTLILDPLRRKIGAPVVITSGYRSSKLNKAVGGSAKSQHCLGQAADIICPGLSVAEVVRTIRSFDLPFDQLIDEFSSWTHVSIAPRRRREVLRATREGKKVVYERVD